MFILAILLAMITTVQAAPQFPVAWNHIADPITTAQGDGYLYPYKIASDATVMPISTGWRMYYSAIKQDASGNWIIGIARADSVNGLHWTTWRKPTNPDPIVDLVVAPFSNTTGGIETASALKPSSNPNGQHRMYYSEVNGSTTYAIGLSTSPTGETWTRKGTGPIFKPLYAWEQPVDGYGGVLEPSVLYDAATSKYKMWYAAYGALNGLPTFRIGYAESANGASGWVRRDTPVLNVGPPGSWDELWVSHVNVIADPAGGYHMFYHSTAVNEYVEGASMQPGNIGHAVSVDGITWQRNPNNPIIRYKPGFAAWTVVGPSAVYANGKLRVYYSGFNDPNAYTSTIGVVEAQF